jgi:phosphate-selective porin
MPSLMVSDAGAAGTGDLEARLAALERQVTELAGENQALRARLAGGSDRATPVWVRPEGQASGLSLGGLLQVQAESAGVPDSRYAGVNERVQLRRMRLAFCGAFAEQVSFKLEADFGNGSVAGRTGASGQLTDAFVAWSRFPGLNLRLGQFKTPFGHEQLTADSKAIFVERSLTNDRLTVGRQIGVQASGEIVRSVLGYSIGAFNGCGTNAGANDNGRFMTAARVAATVYRGNLGELPARWNLGVNGFDTTDQASFTGRRIGRGIDTQASLGPAMVGTEWLRQDSRPAVGSPVEADGWSVFGTWNFNRWWQGVWRFERFDAGTPRLDATTREWTLGFNYFVKGDDLKLLLNYQFGRTPLPHSADGRWLGRMQVVF